MGRMLICCGRKADEPLYMREFQVFVSTIEELCYCLKKNLHMLDDSIMNEQICRFIEQELGMEKLAKQLREVIEKQVGLPVFVRCIMKYIGYLSEEELILMEAELKEVEGKSNAVRKKAKADFWLESKKYAKAAREYYRILQEETLEDDKIKGDIYHNLGTIYSRMFFFDKAATYYQIAYEKNKDEESYACYLLALHVHLPKEEYVKVVTEELVSEEMALALEQRLGQALIEEKDSCKRNRMDEVLKYRQLGYVQEYYYALEKVLEEYKAEYRGSMSEG